MHESSSLDGDRAQHHSAPLDLSPPPVPPFVIMSFTRFVEIGRVVLINYGEDAGKLGTIVDVVDNGRALVDGPTAITGVTRQIIPFKRLSLTDLKAKIGRGARQKALKKAWTEGDIKAQWDASSWRRSWPRGRARARLTLTASARCC